MLASLRTTAVTALLVATGTPVGAQETPQPTDWTAAVAKAQTHRRIMVRRAAAGKVAKAGDIAIDAVRAYARRHGLNKLRLELVTAYGLTTAGGSKTHALLEEWARDREFYWRSQALAALAHRRLSDYRGLFAEHLDDVAYLTRIQAGRGLCRLDVDRDKVLALLRDPDPRVRLRVAVCLVEEKDDRGLPTLVEALRQEGAFLDYPWGRLGANVAFKLLRKVAGEGFDFTPGETPAANAAAIKRFEGWARARLGDRWVEAVPAHRDGSDYRGGIEIRSCRNGDLFIRWTADRQLVFGLEAHRRGPVSEAAFAALEAGPPKSGRPRHGKVVCDFIRLICRTAAIDEKSAPASLPPGSTRWLESLAATLDADRGAQIRGRLKQFRRE